jgi:putative membrane protein
MTKRLRTALIALPAALGALPALAQTPADRPDYWHPGWGWGWGHMVLGSLMMVLFWGGIILIVVLAVRWGGGASSPGAVPQIPHKTALDILQERFARGEIDKKEFEERKRLLSD